MRPGVGPGTSRFVALLICVGELFEVDCNMQSADILYMHTEYRLINDYVIYFKSIEGARGTWYNSFKREYRQPVMLHWTLGVGQWLHTHL